MASQAAQSAGGADDTRPRFGVSFVGKQLALLSFGSACMDILSYKELGQVFTSAMTGNAALLGLEIGQGDLTASSRNVTAFVAFLLGLVWGAAMLRHQKSGWSGAITRTLGVECALLVLFSAIWAYTGGPEVDYTRYVLIAVSAVAMGIQSAAAHTIGVPGITTTYFTGTITNIIVGAVGRTVKREPPSPTRRKMRWPVTAFVAYVTGAAVTGLLVSRAAFLPSIALTALPAITVAIVLLAALVDWRRAGQG